MYKKILNTTLIIVLLSCSCFQSHAQIKSYVAKYKTLATRLSSQYGIPVKVILGIAIVESSCGTGRTSEVLHNHFGIVGKNHVFDGTRQKSRYKEYADAADSYRDFCKVIAHKRFYPKLKNTGDYKVWIKAIRDAGYSEIPAAWEHKVLTAINTNRL